MREWSELLKQSHPEYEAKREIDLENAVENAAEKATEKTTEKTTETVTETVIGKAADASTENNIVKTTDQATETSSENSTEKSLETYTISKSEAISSESGSDLSSELDPEAHSAAKVVNDVDPQSEMVFQQMDDNQEEASLTEEPQVDVSAEPTVAMEAHVDIEIEEEADSEIQLQQIESSEPVAAQADSEPAAIELEWISPTYKLTEKITNIPDRMAFKIGEAADYVEVKGHVLRYWESEFDSLKPKKSKNGQRMYSRKDIESALMIKKLLYEDRFSVEGARSALRKLKKQMRESQKENPKESPKESFEENHRENLNDSQKVHGIQVQSNQILEEPVITAASVSIQAMPEEPASSDKVDIERMLGAHSAILEAITAARENLGLQPNL